MKLLLCLMTVTLLLTCAAIANGGNSEDLDFAKELFRRKWYDWAEEVAKDLAASPQTRTSIRCEAAELHCLIVEEQANATGDESLRQKAQEMRKKYERMFTSPWPETMFPQARFVSLEGELRRAQDLAKKSETEPDDKKSAAMKNEALELFKKLDSQWEGLIEKLREEVASFPPMHEWAQWAQKASREEQEHLLDKVWLRDLSEYLYAAMFIYYAKVVPGEKKAEIIRKGLKKFTRFVDGEPEHPNDSDPPAMGQDEPQEPEPRLTYRWLDYLAEIGIGQCHLEMDDYDNAVVHFDYMVAAELPPGSETSEEDIKRIVDIRLQAYYLEGYAYNLAKKHKLAKEVLGEMLNLSGKPVQPDRGKVITEDPETGETYGTPLSIEEYWQRKNKPQVPVIPDVRKTDYGKLAAIELAKALKAVEGEESTTAVESTNWLVPGLILACVALAGVALFLLLRRRA